MYPMLTGRIVVTRQHAPSSESVLLVGMLSGNVSNVNCSYRGTSSARSE